MVSAMFCVLITIMAIPALSNARVRGEVVRSRRSLQDRDTHDHEGDTDLSTCTVSRGSLAYEFTELAEEVSLMGCEGELCRMEIDQDHDPHNETNKTYCGQTFHFVERLLVRLNLTTPCCLGNGNETTCHKEMTSSTRPTPAQAYGIGFLLVSLVSLGSLLGLFMLPFTRNPRLKQYYQYIYALLISMGASALFCDAILHLIPEAFGLHAHEAGVGTHAEEESSGEEFTIIWRSCVVILGLYLFFLFEFVLHTWSSHSHSLSSSHSHSKSELVNLEMLDRCHDESNKKDDNKTTSDDNKCPQDCKVTDATFPHGTCSSGANGINSGIIHPTEEKQERCEDCENSKTNSWISRWSVLRYLSTIKPLAWLIIVGDGLHNFADGLALGAAISQSLSLGLSTAIALVFHEIPHELGDYVILLSTGMTWYAALFFNFVSALTAIVGFFVGVSIGTASEEANNWVLAAAAGIFLYIALVDLLPELIHTKEQGLKRFVLFVMINIGFIISFVALLLLAIYEENLENLVRI